MKYLISNKIVFNSDNTTLFLYESNQIISKLTNPASRLLLLLIQNNKTTISREDLLEKVWISYGFTASNAGLNNYISELRKAFTLLELTEEVIITIPKVGFRFESDIVPLEQTIKNRVDTLTPEEETQCIPQSKQPETNDQKMQRKKIISRLNGKKLLITFALVIIFTAAIIISIVIMKNEDDTFPYHLTLKIDKCDVYLVSKKENNLNKEYVSSIIRDEGIDCKNKQSDIFYMNEFVSGKFIRYGLLSICSKENNDKMYSTCLNISNHRVTTK